MIGRLFLLALLLAVPGAMAQEGPADVVADSSWRPAVAEGDSLVLREVETEVVQVVEGRPFNARRFWTGVGVVAAADVGMMVALNELWYKDYPRSRFHWHDDWDNWAQQDKIGHLLVAYQLARVLGHYGRWSGLSPGQAALFGGGASFVFQSQIEILDGFSEKWGASWGDIVANAAGSALGAAQIADPRLKWYTLKYSYRPSPYYDAKAGYLGNVLKDYDGISYWLVLRPADMLPEGTPWPRWLAVSVGHGADNLRHARSRPDFPHQRLLFVGLDLDVLTTVDWPYPWMRTVAGFFSFVRIPAPALQLTPDLRWHWLYW
jgi:uncharacterized protein YfiM (DUF2279 family)